MTDVAERRRTAAPKLAQEAAKRTLDISSSLALIIILAPLLLLLWWLVRSTSAGPALFRQERVGRDIRPFTMLKLRTMYVDNDDLVHRTYVAHLLAADRPAAAGPDGLFKLEQDPRVTRLGVWLRRSSLDELPQLFNVLHGEMSLVGPRPVLPWEARMFEERYRRRFLVKPGITGLWQVNGRSRVKFDEMVRMDLRYARTWSPLLDLKIIMRTPGAVFEGKGAY